MGLPWIKVAVDLPDHPKVSEFEDALGLEAGVGLGVLVSIWCWAARVCPTGHVPESAFRSMVGYACRNARVTHCNAELTDHDHFDDCYGPPLPSAVFKALRSSGLADSDSKGGFKLHDWDMFNSAHAREAEQNRERQRVFRQKHPKVSTKNSPAYQQPPGHDDVTETSNESVTGEVTGGRYQDRDRDQDGDGDQKQKQDPPLSPKGGLSGSGLRFSKRPRKGDTLAQEVLRAEQDVVTDRARVLWNALEQQPMDEAEMLAFAQARWKSGPANERVVGEALKALQAQGGPRPVKPVEVWQRPEWVPFLAAQEQSIEGLSSAEVAKAFEAFVASHTQGPEVRE